MIYSPETAADVSSRKVFYRKVNVFNKDAHSYQSLGGDYQQDLRSCLALARCSAYGSLLDQGMPEMWEHLLIENRMLLAMIEETEEVKDANDEWRLETRPIGFRFIVFLTEKFYRHLLYSAEAGTLEPSICAPLFQRHRSGNSPILTRPEIAHANSNEGLNVLAFAIHDDAALATQAGILAYASAVIKAMEQMTRGYNMKAALLEGYSVPARQQIEYSGCKVITDYTSYYHAHGDINKQHRMFLAHADREMVQQPGMAGTIMYTNSRYNPPLLEMNTQQREILEFALEGADDQLLAEHYGVKEEAIRKRFSGILRSVRNKMPRELAAKKRLGRAELLEYVRDHVEEVRPCL